VPDYRIFCDRAYGGIRPETRESLNAVAMWSWTSQSTQTAFLRQSNSPGRLGLTALALNAS